MNRIQVTWGMIQLWLAAMLSPETVKEKLKTILNEETLRKYNVTRK